MENKFLNSKKKDTRKFVNCCTQKSVLEGKKVITSHKRMVTHTKRVERHTGQSDVSSYSSSKADNGHDWKDCASLLEKENLQLKK
jgi:hypothetical protein